MPDALPSANTLLDTLRVFLEKDIAPQVDARSAYLLKVATHLLDTLGRELQLSQPAITVETARLQALLDDTHCTNVDRLNRQLCLRIATGEQDLSSQDLWTHLLQTTKDRLAVDNPRYQYRPENPQF